jgi:hypothetical protein
MTREVAAAIVKAFRRVALPLAWYYAVTLAIPLANGAAQAGATLTGHALVVLVVPLILIAFVGAAHQLACCAANAFGPRLFLRPLAKLQGHGSHLDDVSIGKGRDVGDSLSTNKSAVGALEVGEHGTVCAALDSNPRMAPRHASVIHPDFASRIPADDVVPFG